jgi:predicted metalloprotease with PDZ domain
MKIFLLKLLIFIFLLSYSEISADLPVILQPDGKENLNKSRQGPRSNQQFEINFSIEPFYDVNTFRLIVVLEFHGDKSGETKLFMPNGSDFNSVKYLKPLSPNTFIIDTDKPEYKTVKYQPGSSVRIYYQFEEARDGELELGNHYMAIINKQYFHFLGDTFFILPAWDENTECSFRIVWNHLPANWNITNSFGVNEKYQELKLSLWKFRHSVFTGGDFKIVQRYIAGEAVCIAIRGKWKFPEDQLGDLIRDILIEERNFWSDHNFPFFLITVLPLSQGGEQSGIVRFNSYSLFLSNNRSIDFRLKQLLSHDLFHTWIGEKIQFAEPEQLVYWFKEGFTDYYANLLLLRAKLISLDEYIDQYNAILETYYTSSMRFEKNERLINEFWSDKDLTKLPYQRGQIFAHNLNYIIYKNSSGKKSLDHLMRDLMARCLNESLIISNGSLSALIRFYAGDQILSEMMRTLNSGAVLKTIPEALGPCFKMDIDSRKKLIIFGEQYDVPSYKLKSDNQQTDKNCLGWFGAN